VGIFSSPNNLSIAVDLKIGSESNGGEPFPVKLDDVQIINNKLTTQQVRDIYNSGYLLFSPNAVLPNP
jgi:hypothetical protein